MRQLIVLGLLLCLLAGCQNQNCFTTYGSQILIYEGDANVLANCCAAAMSLMGDDLQKEMALESPPKVKMVGRGFSEDGEFVAGRNISIVCVDEKKYRIETIAIAGKSTTVVVDAPNDDSRLINHLMEIFSTFDVKGH